MSDIDGWLEMAYEDSVAPDIEDDYWQGTDEMGTVWQGEEVEDA